MGDGGCGKTCLLIVFTKYEFPSEYTPCFDNFQEYQMNLDDKKVKILTNCETQYLPIKSIVQLYGEKSLGAN